MFYLFFIYPELKDLLLDELKLNHPKLSLSFSNNEFVSMKGPKNYETKLCANPVVFSRRMGIFIKKADSPSEYSVQAQASEYWHYSLIDGPWDTFDLLSAEKPPLAPARAWHKIQEACNHFNFDFNKGDQVIEIGSAPGGISYYILCKQAKLLAIDPAKMDKNLLQFEDNFCHLQKSIFEVQKNHLPQKCDWLVSDLNLAGDLNIGQCRRIVDLYPNIKGGFITIKTPKSSDLKNISKWKETFKKFSVNIIHLPSHRREVGLFFKA